MDYLDSLEKGRLLWLIMVFVFAMFIVSTAVSLFDIQHEPERITIYTNHKQKLYYIRKVSSIPEKDKAKEEAKQTVDDGDGLTEASIRDRYISYVISKIQACKVFPETEQKLGHQGSVVLKVYLGRDGKVQKASIVRAARYPKLTGAAIDSLKKANPFYPFPPQLKEQKLIITVEILFVLQ